MPKIIPDSITPGAAHEFRAENIRTVRPKDASTLIIVREEKGKATLLMGKRAATHKFMPNKFVFPGGRVDPVDSRVKVAKQLNTAVKKRLQKEISARTSEARLRALALAAIRETYEETGVVVGATSKKRVNIKHNDWQSYFDYGVEPPLHAMDFIARAITPPQRVRRFDTRFFMISADYLHTPPEELDRASGELTDLHWISPKEAESLDLPIITQQVLKIISQRLALPAAQRLKAPTMFFKFDHGKPSYSEI